MDGAQRPEHEVMTEAEIIKWIVIGLMSVGVWFMKRTIDRVEHDVEEVKNNIQKAKTLAKIAEGQVIMYHKR